MVTDEYLKANSFKTSSGRYFRKENKSRKKTQLEMDTQASHTSHEITVRLLIFSPVNIVLFKHMCCMLKITTASEHIKTSM